MRGAALVVAFLVGAVPGPLAARETVEASPPSALAVTLYRAPNRGEDEAMDRDCL